MIEVIVRGLDALGKVIYYATYIPLWLFYQVAGRPMWRAWINIVVDDEEKAVERELSKVTLTPDKARELLRTSYYNWCVREIAEGRLV